MNDILKNDTVINLSEDLIVGRGFYRNIYRHPLDSTKCIKVPVNSKKILENNDSRLEYFYFLEKNIKVSYIPKFHGVVLTTEGEGSVFDLITENDNQVSLNLKEIISKEKAGNDYIMVEKIFKKFKEIRNQLVKDRFVFFDFSLRNILYQKKTEKLMIIDGLYDRNFIPLASWFPYFNRKKIKRKYKKLADNTDKNGVPEKYLKYFYKYM